MKTKLELSDITKGERLLSEGIDIGDGYRLHVGKAYDNDSEAPWKREDGHGPVSKFKRHPFGQGTKPPTRAGERILYWDSGSYRTYNVKEASSIAKRDGWGLAPEQLTMLAETLGRAPTRGEIVAEAVRRDFERLRAWCNDEWHYCVVTVTLTGPDGVTIVQDSVGGIESDGDQWREVAAEIGSRLLSEAAKERDEAAYWAARDTITQQAGGVEA